MRQFLLAATMLALAGLFAPALAQPPSSVLSEEHTRLFGDNWTDVERDAYSAAHEILSGGAGQNVDKEALREITRRSLGIADDAMQQARDNALGALGVDDEQGRLYVFVSSSMPRELIQAYSLEAIWSGAVLVFRGIPEDQDLAGFLTGYLNEFVNEKGGTATIQIDPRLFDVFHVTAVPTLVYSEVDEFEICSDPVQSVEKVEGQEMAWNRCYQAGPEDGAFYKLSGNVTIHYALERFLEAGVRGAQARYQALTSQGFWSGMLQRDFEGEWDEIPLPGADR